MVKVLGHRGIRQAKGIDENSLAAIESALRTADGVEIDVSVSAQGTPFVIHDITRRPFMSSSYKIKEQLDKHSRKITGRKRLDQMTDEEIEKLRLKKGAKIPQLSEVFALAAQYPDSAINIELKGQNSLASTLQAIETAVAAGQIVKSQITLSSFDHAAIAEAKRKAPEIKRGLLFANAVGFRSMIFPWSEDKSRRYRAFNEKSLSSQAAREAVPDFLILTACRVNAKKIALMRKHQPQASLAVWSSREEPPSRSGPVSRLLDDPDIRPHLTTVITDYPEIMKKKFTQNGEMK